MLGINVIRFAITFFIAMVMFNNFINNKVVAGAYFTTLNILMLIQIIFECLRFPNLSTFTGLLIMITIILIAIDNYHFIARHLWIVSTVYFAGILLSINSIYAGTASILYFILALIGTGLSFIYLRKDRSLLLLFLGVVFILIDALSDVYNFSIIGFKLVGPLMSVLCYFAFLLKMNNWKFKQLLTSLKE